MMKNMRPRNVFERSIQLIAVLVFVIPILLQEPVSSAITVTGQRKFAGQSTSRPPRQVSPEMRRDGSFKSILTSVPPHVREQFLKSLMFKNGKLVTAYIGGIKFHLRPAEYKQLFQSLGISREPGDYEGYACDGNATCVKAQASICISKNCTVGGSKASPLGELLANVPQSERTRFLESLDFVNGRLASAQVNEIRMRMKSTEFEKLVSNLAIRATPEGAIIEGNRVRLRRGYSFEIISRNEVAVVATRTKATTGTFKCECSGKKGDCIAGFSDGALSCKNGGCDQGCIFTITIDLLRSLKL